MSFNRRVIRFALRFALLAASSCAQDHSQSPTSPSEASFSEEEIALDTGSGTLYGTLAMPPDSPPFTHVALIVAGSGPTDRNGNSAALPGRNDSLLQLAHALATRGVASLRFDKRGVGKSAAAGPAESELRFETYVEDTSAWLDYLRADPRFRSVAIVGHSEGSLVGMLSASPNHCDAFISVSGLSRPASLVLKEQVNGQLSAELLAESDRILTSLEQGEEASNVPAELAGLYRPSVQPYLISWFKYDPSEELGRVDAPILIVHGDTDRQVPVSDALALHEAAPGSQLAILQGVNHVLKQVADDREQSASYSDPSFPVAPELVETISDFLR